MYCGGLAGLFTMSMALLMLGNVTNLALSVSLCRTPRDFWQSRLPWDSRAVHEPREFPGLAPRTLATSSQVWRDFRGMQTVRDFHGLVSQDSVLTASGPPWCCDELNLTLSTSETVFERLREAGLEQLQGPSESQSTINPPCPVQDHISLESVWHPTAIEVSNMSASSKPINGGSSAFRANEKQADLSDTASNSCQNDINFGGDKLLQWSRFGDRESATVTLGILDDDITLSELGISTADPWQPPSCSSRPAAEALVWDLFKSVYTTASADDLQLPQDTALPHVVVSAAVLAGISTSADVCGTERLKWFSDVKGISDDMLLSISSSHSGASSDRVSLGISEDTLTACEQRGPGRVISSASESLHEHTHKHWPTKS